MVLLLLNSRRGCFLCGEQLTLLLGGNYTDLSISTVLYVVQVYHKLGITRLHTEYYFSPFCRV